MSPTSRTRARLAGICAGLLVVLLSWYIPQKSHLQQTSCHLAPLFSSYLSTVIPAEGPLRTQVDAFLKWFHEASASFIWMQAALVVGLLFNWDVGMEMYKVVIIGHIIKNFAKSFIASPRGFWFCQEGFAIHCGTGYSLPSGHSMMSLLVMLFLIYKSKSLAVVAASVLLELFIVFEIIYLGTHTNNDTAIGFAFGITWFAIYLYLEDDFKHHRRDHSKTSPRLFNLWLVLLWLLIVVEVYLLEGVEMRLDASTSHPLEQQENYQRYCRLEQGQAARKMRNSTGNEKTALLLGLVIAESLRRLAKIHGFLDQKTNLATRLIRTALLLAVFTTSKALLAAVAGPLSGDLKYLPLMVQPSLMLVFFPLFCHVTKLGTFMGIVPTHEKVD